MSIERGNQFFKIHKIAKITHLNLQEKIISIYEQSYMFKEMYAQLYTQLHSQLSVPSFDEIHTQLTQQLYPSSITRLDETTIQNLLNLLKLPIGIFLLHQILNRDNISVLQQLVKSFEEILYLWALDLHSRNPQSIRSLLNFEIDRAIITKIAANLKSDCPATLSNPTPFDETSDQSSFLKDILRQWSCFSPSSYLAQTEHNNYQPISKEKSKSHSNVQRCRRCNTQLALTLNYYLKLIKTKIDFVK